MAFVPIGEQEQSCHRSAFSHQGTQDSRRLTHMAARDRKQLHHQLREENPRRQYQVNGGQAGVR